MIYFYAYSRVGGDAFNNVSQPMVSRFIDNITRVIVRHLTPNYVRFPQTEEERRITKDKFERKYNMPGTLGLIDGTHVGMAAMPHIIEHAFMNRKYYHSINVQIVCDSDMMITSVNCRYSGSTHDSFVFNNSRIYALLEAINNEQPDQWNWLIGDSAYALSPWLIKVFPNNANMNDAERHFNRRMQVTRSLVERVIALLKMRFRCLLDSERRIRYSPTKVGLIVYACATLHNILLRNGFDIMHNINVNDAENIQINEEIIDIANIVGGEIRRNELVQYLQNQR